MYSEPIVITRYILNKCSDFAKKSAESSLDRYAAWGQKNLEKITKDITVGKIGEEVVYRTLVKKFSQLTKPDFNIYEKKEKNWSPDLTDEGSGIRLAVKCQESASAIAYSDSWVFQFNQNKNFDCDNKVFKEIDPNHYVAFVSLNLPKKVAEIRSIVRIQWLHDNNLFQQMKVFQLRGNKVAVYYDDLVKFKDDLWQL